MSTAPKNSSPLRNRLMAAAASLAIAGAIGFGAVTTGTAPVLADAVKVEAPQVPSFADVVSQVSPAVVSVRVKANVQPTADDGPDFFNGQDGLPDNPQLRRFFKQFRQFGNPYQDQDHRAHRDHRSDKPRPVAQGSGFFISDDGYLVTNNHVVQEGSAFTVVMDDGKELDAKLIGTDPRTDLAVLKVDGNGQKFTYVDFADDSKVRVGDWVVAVGNPFGLGGTVTAGIVSARGRDIGGSSYGDFLQIDAAVNTGNSGGPTFDTSGKVAGMNTAIFSPNGGNVGIAFAIPASTIKPIVQQLIDKGTVTRGFLGVQIQDVTHDIANSVGLKTAKGALVTQPSEGGPAQKAGINSGDIITAVDGTPIDNALALSRTIANKAPETKVELTLWRNGKEEKVTVTLDTLKDQAAQGDEQQQQQQPAQPEAPKPSSVGITLVPNAGGEGLLIQDVNQDSIAADKGFTVGDLILEVDNKKVANVDEFEKAIQGVKDRGLGTALVKASRDGNIRYIGLPLEASK